MEGWLYLIRSNKFGCQYSRKHYYVLHNLHFKTFTSVPHSLHKDPVRSAIVSCSICVTDNGRKSIKGKVLFIFTLSGISSNGGCVKLGARNPEEATRWVEAFRKVSLKMNQRPGDIVDCAKYDQKYARSGRLLDIVGNPFSSASIADHATADISSYWTVFGCHNGLRLFKETKNHEELKKRNTYPGNAIAAMSVIDGAPESVFQILMSLGSSRSEWDFCFRKGNVIERIDDHTDIIHKLLNDDWLPWGMKRRDLLLQRYWMREDDGTYSGGYVISPVNKCKQSVLRHILDIDWKLGRSYLPIYSAQSLSINMIGRLAALREFFKTNVADYLSASWLQESEREDLLHPSRTSMQGYENVKVDEFFDFPDTFVDDQLESSCDASFHPEICSQDLCHDEPCDLPANDLEKKLHECTMAADRKGCEDSDKIVWEDSILCSYYKFTLPKDPTGYLANSWSVPEPCLFHIRGETYFEDHKKIAAKSTLMQTVGVEWLRSDKKEDHLAAQPGNIVQKFGADGRPEFFFIVNFQIPGSTTYNIASYYMTTTSIQDLPLLEKFVDGDDAFRNSRFKLIPHVTKGPWVLKQSVSRATLVGQLLKINYIRGNNYIELDIDVGSSVLARGLANTALSCFNSLISETAFVIQANTRDELPEQLYGAYRLNYLDVSKAFWANS